VTNIRINRERIRYTVYCASCLGVWWNGGGGTRAE